MGVNMKRKVIATVLILITAVLVCGCTVKSGVFTGLSQSSSGTTLSASYRNYDGAIWRRVTLEEVDTVRFELSGGDGLDAVVKKDGEAVFSIVDGSVFTAPSDGSYNFAVQGQAENGSFSLSWQVE